MQKATGVQAKSPSKLSESGQRLESHLVIGFTLIGSCNSPTSPEELASHSLARDWLLLEPGVFCRKSFKSGYLCTYQE